MVSFSFIYLSFLSDEFIYFSKGLAYFPMNRNTCQANHKISHYFWCKVLPKFVFFMRFDCEFHVKIGLSHVNCSIQGRIFTTLNKFHKNTQKSASYKNNKVIMPSNIRYFTYWLCLA